MQALLAILGLAPPDKKRSGEVSIRAELWKKQNPQLAR